MKNKSKQSGFTLIETFVAVLILVFAVIAPLGLLARAISDGNFAKNQVIAYFLAQEGVELVINQRDKNVDRGEYTLPDPDSWLNNLDRCEYGCNPSYDGGFEFCRDDNLSAIADIEGDTARCLLYITDSEDKFYTNTEGTGNVPSMFYRQVKIDHTEGDMFARVTARVSWVNKGRVSSSVVSTTMINPYFEIVAGGGGGDDDGLVDF